MTTATAIAHPNIALVKYWGKRDLALNLPAVPSLSLTLDGFRTRTSVRWGATADRVVFQGRDSVGSEARKILAFLDLLDPGRPPCEVVTDNDFPTGAGLASSASGFAALAVAANAASNAGLSDDQLSVLARRGSGSACRSLFGGLVVWRLGDRADGSDSHGVPLLPPDAWELRMVVAIVSAEKKAVGSTAGMLESERTSPYWPAWVAGGPPDLEAAIAAVEARDLHALGEVMESSTLKMHAVMHTTRPAILYWQPATVACLHAVRALREAGVPAWATMDAGPNVKVLCEAAHAEAVAAALRPLVASVVTLAPGSGARVVAA